MMERARQPAEEEQIPGMEAEEVADGLAIPLTRS